MKLIPGKKYEIVNDQKEKKKFKYVGLFYDPVGGVNEYFVFSNCNEFVIGYPYVDVSFSNQEINILIKTEKSAWTLEGLGLVSRPKELNYEKV